LHIFWTWLLGVVALLWIAEAIDIAIGVPSIPSLADAAPLPDAKCPTISILFAGRDEAVKLPNALDTLLTLDYPRYEVVAVDDRSEDATGTILANAAQKDSRLKAVRVDSLPAGWLGKPHALQKAYEASSGEWIVFTDADVHFAPDLLRRAIALAESKSWEHMTLLGRVKMFTVGEKIAMTFFGLAMMVGTRPWRTSDPGSRVYTGVGAFQMIRRSAYEKMGTHRRLAMEVVDDMKLGKLVKEAGIRSGVAKAGDAVSVHWHAGVGNIIRGTTKNFFATSGFKLWLTSLHILGLLLMFVLPVVALPFVHGWARAFAAIAVVLPLIAEIGVAIEFESQPLYALTYPIGALIFTWMLLRSMIVTLWQGGIVWRGTFYPLKELKRGVV
jgi:cellulose synthase/poly-beta-1,6-N-acetylglucosamine synthase-like glycosyltransferase